jgi:uncharacterized protein (DUF58 family)
VNEVRSSTRPTRRAFAVGFGALLLFGVGTNVQAGWILVVAALLLGILVAGLVLPLRALRGIEVTRTVPRTAFEGDTVPVTLGVVNTTKQARSLFRIRDEFLGKAHAVVDTVAPRSTRSYEAARTGARRGVHASGLCVVESAAPFGVLRVTRRMRIASPVVVYPRVYDAQRWRLRGPAGWPSSSSLGDVSSVREYKPGDPLRHIHWRSSAKKGQLVVRDFERETNVSTVVYAEVPDRIDEADAVATIACSIALSALREGDVTVGGSQARSADPILEWGARLAPVHTLNATTIDDSADSVVYVGTAALMPVDRLSAIASSTAVSVVVVDDGAVAGTGADAVATRLRSAGATVAVVKPAGVRTWFEDGCIAS